MYQGLVGGGGAAIEDLSDASDRSEPHAALSGFDLDPQTEVILTDFCNCLSHILPTDQMRRVLQMKLEGFTNGEIAHTLGVSERTIERKCMLIREHARRLDVTTSTLET